MHPQMLRALVLDPGERAARSVGRGGKAKVQRQRQAVQPGKGGASCMQKAAGGWMSAMRVGSEKARSKRRAMDGFRALA